MKIYFGYIEGISRIDTPYFANISEQEDYFDSHEVVTIDNTFYPPHYTNVIKVDSEDIDFNITVNYVWFEYLGKRYYYFIDDIEYISETIAKFYITMDTIQTYMFNIRVTNGIIERKFINRWKNNFTKINRAYLRENVSEGIFDVDNFEVFNSDRNQWFYIYKTTELNSEKNVGNKVCIDENWDPNGPNGVSTPLNTLFAPYIRKDYVYGGTSFSISGDDVTVRLAQKNWCVDIFIIPFNPFKWLDIDGDELVYESHRVNYDSNLVLDYYFDMATNPNDESNHFYSLRSNFQAKHSIGTLQATTNYIMTRSYSGARGMKYNNTNNQIYKPFNITYMPMLCDENYLRYTFGSNFVNTTLPLSLIIEKTFYYKYYADVENGRIIYCLDDTNSFTDRFRTTIVDSNLIGVPMKNSPWSDYVSQNRARWGMAIGETALDIITKGANVGIRNASIQAEMSDIVTDKRNYTPKTGVLKKKYQRMLNSKNRDIEENLNSYGIDAASKSIGGVIGQGIQDINNYCKPSTVVQQGNTIPSLNHDYEIFLKTEVVRDIHQCAHYFHRNGVLVNEYINSRDNIFDYVNTRYYFNVLKMSDVDLHLANIVEDVTSVESVKDRLSNGLRLWNKVAKLIETPYLATYADDESTRTVAIPYVGTYLEDNIEIENLSGNHYIASKAAANGILTIVIYRNAPGAYRLHGIIKSYDTTQQDINIGNFEYDNVEKIYIS